MLIIYSYLVKAQHHCVSGDLRIFLFFPPEITIFYLKARQVGKVHAPNCQRAITYVNRQWHAETPFKSNLKYILFKSH